MSKNPIVDAFKAIVGIERAAVFAAELDKSVDELTGFDIYDGLGSDTYYSLTTYAKQRVNNTREIKRKGGRP